VACWLALCCVPLAFIDAALRRLPDVLTCAALADTALLLLAAAAAGGHWHVLAQAVLGGVALAGFYLVLALISPAGMGMGDVKAASGLGGWRLVAVSRTAARWTPMRRSSSASLARQALVTSARVAVEHGAEEPGHVLGRGLVAGRLDRGGGVDALDLAAGQRPVLGDADEPGLFHLAEVVVEPLGQLPGRARFQPQRLQEPEPQRVGHRRPVGSRSSSASL